MARATSITAPRSGAASGPHIEGYAFVVGGGQPDAEVYRFATIKTDHDDYAPGQTAIITGSGWEANEEVTLLFQEDPAVHDDYVLTVTADGDGNIYHDQWAPEQHDLGVRFYLMSIGQEAGRRAQTTFTDSTNFQNLQVGNQSPTIVAQGSSATYPVTISFNVTQNTQTSCTVGTFVANNLPAGATATFLPTSVTRTTAGDESVTMTVNTTAATPVGTFSGGSGPNVTAVSVGCGSVNPRNFTLRVGAPTSLVLSAPSPASVTQGSAGPVTLSATLSAGTTLLSGQTIAFSVAGVTVGSGTTNGSGVATFSYNPSTLTVGPHTVTAFYDGANIGGTLRGSATSNQQTLNVTPATVATTTVVSSSLNPSTYGDSVTFTATVSATSTPTGSVNFVIDGGSPVAGTPGPTTATTATWTYTTSTLNVTGSPHSVSASYVHTGSFQDSNGSLASGQVVNARPVTLTGTRPYDGTANADFSILTVSNAIAPDVVTVASGAATLASKNAGPQAITSVGSLTLGGADAGNYTLVGATGTVTITQLPVTLTGTRPYDGTTNADFSILTVSNAIAPDVVTVASGCGHPGEQECRAAGDHVGGLADARRR